MGPAVGIVMIVYLGVFVWAIVTSHRRPETLLWMIGSWFVGWLAVSALIIWHYGMPEQIGAFIMDLWMIPSFAVPAVVGVLHAKRSRRA